ncbi:hypothetical protein HPB51_025537 [Rhipicephalus microplus]|uniref:Uncharacterized protein n=1 Tax=Rhipicephalus microplus TaxID=6941 RepID=A0A9J6F8M1_RHIMP|nr:hypothetical protein HPB51_025537 [Rhipicephalus microplus]
MFHDVSARREDFTTVTSQETFSLNFAPHRWVENVAVIERAIALWDDEKRYVECTKRRDVNILRCRSYTQISAFCQDPLLLAKVKFATAMILKPFLTEYQLDKPLIFFLKNDVESLMRQLLTSFVKCTVLIASAGSMSILTMGLSDPNNHVSAEKLDVGHAAREIIKAAKVFVENLKEISHASCHSVTYDAVSKAGGVNTAITKELLKSVSAAHSYYQAYLEEKKKQANKQAKISKRSNIEKKIHSIKVKRR